MKKKEEDIISSEEREMETAADETNNTDAENSEMTLSDDKENVDVQREEDELTKANNEIERLKDQYLRRVAEFDNYRKRTLKEKADLIRNGGENVIKEMLPVLDDFERAWDNIEKTDDINTLKEGVSLIMKKFRDTLAAQGLKAIDTNGVDFDTDYHEAISLMAVDDDAKKGKVIDCVSTGYTLNDKVIRFAKVVVGN